MNTVLEGSVRKSGNRVRITAQLISSADGYHLWSERYDREMKDIFDVQDEIALAVVDALKVKLLGKEKAAVLKRYTNNPEAYQLFLKGRYHWYKQTPENVRKSRDYFQQAIDLDPAYAPGYAGLSEYYGISAALGMTPPNESWQKAEAAMMKAQELDDTLPEVHNGLAAIRMFYYRDWRGAEREIKRTIELNPRFAEVHHLYAYCLVAVGRLDDAIAEVRRALELDPLSLIYNRYLGTWLYYGRRYEEAIRQYHQAIELDPNNAPVHEDLGQVFERAGLHREAVAEWQRAMTLEGDDELAAIPTRAFTETDFAAAVRAVAEQKLEQLNRRLERGDYIAAIHFARVYTRLGKTEQAFAWLEKACEERNVFPLLIHADPFYDSLRSDARFAALLRRFSLTSDESSLLPAASEGPTSIPAPVSIFSEDLQQRETKTQQDQTRQDKLKTRRYLLGAGVLGLLLLVVAGLAYWSYANRRPPIESIAVMPFVNAGGNGEVEYLSDGMTDMLITSLSQLPKLSVKARSSVFRYKGKDASPQQVGKELNVQAILTGHLVQRGNDLSLHIELVDAQTETALWSADYYRSMTNLAALQSEIARDVSEKLRLRLTSTDQQRLAKRGTENAEAYRAYLKGMFYWNKGLAPGYEKSREYFQQAIDLDPTYALAYSGLAHYYAFASTVGLLPPNENWPKAEAAANKALALDDTLAETYNALAAIKLYYYRDWPSAERYFRRGIDLNPNSAEIRAHYSGCLATFGRSEESLAEIQRALGLDPLSPRFNYSWGRILFFMRQHDRAIDQFRKTLELDPNNVPAHELLGYAYEQKGMQREAITEWGKALTLRGADEQASILERAYAASGFEAAVRALGKQQLEKLNERMKRGEYVPAAEYVTAYTRMGDKEQAFAWLDKAVQENYGFALEVKVNPIYDKLRDDPRFQDSMRKAGF